MKPEVILLIYGEGGHKAQMIRLYTQLKAIDMSIEIGFLGLCENDQAINGIENFSLPPIRDKHSLFTTFMGMPAALWRYSRVLGLINSRYRVRGVISTGPGVCILPAIYFKLRSVRIVFLETWSRFETRSMTGRVMYLLADRFYVQHREQLKFYPKAFYGGLL